MAEPGGGVFTYSFDAASRLTSVVNPQGELTTWAYDPLGRVTTLTHANATTVTHAYDAASRTTGVRNAKSDGTAISEFVYSVDEVGNPTGMVLANGDRVTWSYNSLYRLTREQRSGANAYDMTYSYDPSGNRLTKVSSGATTTLSYDQADRLLTTNDGATVTTFSWDANGNNTLVQAGASVTTYTWDGESRLKALALPGGSVVTNTYGSDGLRRKREDGATTAKYVWDGSRLLLESDGSDVTQAVYTSSVGAYGDTVSQRRSNATHYHHPDHLGTVWNLSDSSQATSDSYVFDAWGNQLASSGSTVNPFRYVGALGYYAEPATALTYVRARWLRPATGSWVSVDVLGRANGYRYAAGPATAVDASGMAPVDRRVRKWLDWHPRTFSPPSDVLLPCDRVARCILHVHWGDENMILPTGATKAPYDLYGWVNQGGGRWLQVEARIDGWLCIHCAQLHKPAGGTPEMEWDVWRCFAIRGTVFPDLPPTRKYGRTPHGDWYLSTLREWEFPAEGGTSVFPVVATPSRPGSYVDPTTGKRYRSGSRTLPGYPARSDIWVHSSEGGNWPGTWGCMEVSSDASFGEFGDWMETLDPVGFPIVPILIPEQPANTRQWWAPPVPAT